MSFLQRALNHITGEDVHRANLRRRRSGDLTQSQGSSRAPSRNGSPTGQRRQSTSPPRRGHGLTTGSQAMNAAADELRARDAAANAAAQAALPQAASTRPLTPPRPRTPQVVGGGTLPWQQTQGAQSRPANADSSIVTWPSLGWTAPTAQRPLSTRQPSGNQPTEATIDAYAQDIRDDAVGRDGSKRFNKQFKQSHIRGGS